MSEDLEAKFRVRLDGKDELADFFGKSVKGSQDFSRQLSQSLKEAGSRVSSFASGAKSALSSFAGGNFNQSIASAARGVLEFRDSLTKLEISAGGIKGGMEGLKDQIHSVSRSTNQLQGDVTNAMQAFVERTGDLETARKNIELYGRTATATGAQLEDVARVGESLFSKFKITDQAKSFSILAAQAKIGAIELRDIATQGATVFSAARAANLPSNERGVSEIGALMQVVAGGARGKGKATAADTAVQVSAIFSQIRQKSGVLEASGIRVGDRDQIEVLREIITKTGGDATMLSRIFKNARAFKGVENIAREYRAGKGFGELDKYLGLGSDTHIMDADFTKARGTGIASLKADEISRNAIADTRLGRGAEFIAKHVNEIGIATVALGVFGKGLSLAGTLVGKVSQVAKLGGATGSVISAIGVPRVWVVNMPGGGIPGGGAGPLPTLAKTAAGAVGMAGLAATAIVALGALPFLGANVEREALVKAASGGDEKRRQEALARRASIVHRGGGAVIGDFGTAPQGANAEAVVAAIERNSLKDITININGEEATVEGSGTRAAHIRARRGAGK